MVIYNALLRKEYERIFMCNTAKEIWKTLLITHQGNSQVKDNNIDLLVQQYEQFVIFEDESIDSAFARFNTIITSLKALHEGYSSKNYLIGNLKVHVMIIKKDSEKVKANVERKSLALKAKKESSDEECSTSGSEDKEYAMAVRDFKKFLKRRDPNHLIGECPKPPRDKNQRAFVGGSWSDSDEENDEKIKDETCLIAQAPNEVCSESSYFSDENSSIDDLALDNEYNKLCKMSLKIITKNKNLKAIRNSLENERYALGVVFEPEMDQDSETNEDGIFFNQSKYIKEMLKKSSLEDSKPMKTPMSSDTKLTKDEECESVDSTKYRAHEFRQNKKKENRVYGDSYHAGELWTEMH
ncbi:hypothetical protein Tco_0272837 [Tanacetum coccineum]